MTAPAKKRITQAAIDRALAAAKDAGLRVARFSIAQDGTVTVEAATPEPMDNPSANVQPIKPKAWARR